MSTPVARRRRLLHAIAAGIETAGRAPSGAALAALVGVTPATVYKDLRALAEAGLIAHEPAGRGVAQHVRLTARGRARAGSAAAVPRFGRIPAGPLTDVVAQADDFVSGLGDLVPWMRADDYLLEVEGDSMIEAGLAPGMTLVMRPEVTPESGDICAVYVEGEGSTLKRVFPKPGRVTLQPENPAYRPRTYPEDEVTIQGVLVGAVQISRFRL